MLKKWFTPPSEEETAPSSKAVRVESIDRSTVVGMPAQEPVTAVPGPVAVGTAPPAGTAVGKYNTFDQVYQNATIKPPRLPYNILKVSEMVSSTHLATMSPEAKRCSLLMALEAAGVAVEDVLQDAVIRQRALADYEENQRARLKNFEQSKTDENNKIQAELDRLTKLHMDRIQANLDEVAREQDNFRAWQKSKQQESQRITEAAAYCVPQGSAIGNNSLAGVLERATLVHG
jgi:hypothetical protein